MTGPLSVIASATAQVAVSAGSAARGIASTTVGQVAALGVGVYALTHIGDVLMVVGGVAATAVAVSAGAAAVQQHRGAWRPLGPGLVSTAARMVDGHSCARCQTARLDQRPRRSGRHVCRRRHRRSLRRPPRRRPADRSPTVRSRGGTDERRRCGRRDRRR